MYGMQDHSTPVPLDFRDILAILRIRKMTILSITLFFVVAAVLYSRSQPKVYESRAEVLVRPITFAAGRFTDTGPSLLDMETEAKVATSRGVATLAAKTLRVTTTPDALLSSLSVSEERTSAVLDFTYASHTRSGAQKVAQAFADAYLDYRRQQALDDILASSRAMQEQLTLLENRLDAINTQIATTTDASQRQLLLAQTNLLSGQIALLEQNLVQLTPPDTLPVGDILQPADLPSSASSPKTVRNVGLALMMGLGLAIAWAIFKERLDDRLRGPDDVGAFGEIPVLASIPTPKRRRRSAFVLAVQQNPNSTAIFGKPTPTHGPALLGGQCCPAEGPRPWFTTWGFPMSWRRGSQLEKRLPRRKSRISRSSRRALSLPIRLSSSVPPPWPR